MGKQRLKFESGNGFIQLVLFSVCWIRSTASVLWNLSRGVVLAKENLNCGNMYGKSIKYEVSISVFTRSVFSDLQKEITHPLFL